MSEQNGSKLNLDELARKLRLKVELSSTEDPAEGEFQRSQTEANARLQRRKEAVLFGVATALVVALSGICIWVLLSGGFSSDDKKWATSILTLITGGLVGYLTGKAAK